MKIAITSLGNQMDSLVDPRLGRAAWFIVVDTETMDFNVMPNEAAEFNQGAGIHAAQTMSKLGISAVITGNVGPHAFQILTTTGIHMFTAVNVSVKTAVDQLMNDGLQPIMASAPGGAHIVDNLSATQVPDNLVPPQATGQGMGRGLGRGQGQGMGRGKGQGGGRNGCRRGNGADGI